MKPVREHTREQLEHTLGKSWPTADIKVILRALVEHEQCAAARDAKVDEMATAVERELRSSGWGEVKIAPIVGALRSYGQARRDLAALEAASKVVVLDAAQRDGADGQLVSELRSRIAELEAERLRDGAELKDRFVSLHVAWFGVPGALTPDIVRAEREHLNRVVAELGAERATSGGLRERLRVLRDAATARQEADDALEQATEVLAEALDDACRDLPLTGEPTNG